MPLRILASIILLALFWFPFARPLSADAQKPRPNVLLIVADDQRYDTMDYMPLTQARVFDEGVEFSQAYVNTPLCCPTRATYLTGLYTQNHCVYDNRTLLNHDTVVEMLDQDSYYTGIVGKYLNSYPFTREDGPLPEFDYWVAHGSLGGAGNYFAPELNVNGEWIEHDGYFTYVERDYVLEFLSLVEEQDQPFFLIYAPYAPHYPADPAPEDQDLYPDLLPHRPPSFNEEDVSDKPAVITSLPSLSEEQIAFSDRFRTKQLQSLAALDRSINGVLDRLEGMGELDNTLIIYLSDNGNLWGEHRVVNTKILVYQETSHVPFAIRYPPLISQPRTDDSLVGSIDIAPTIYDVTGVTPPYQLDGQSLLPLLPREVPDGQWRDHMFIEAYHDFVTYRAVHTGEVVYAEYPGGFAEFYDLAVDPFQLENQVQNPDYAPEVQRLSHLLEDSNPAGPGKFISPSCWYTVHRGDIRQLATVTPYLVLTVGLIYGVFRASRWILRRSSR